MTKIKKNVFIGPLPPPLGGVAMINQSFQSLIFEGYENLAFDTSNKKETEDLYKGLPWNNISREYKKVKKLKKFLKNNKPNIANVFVTSSYSIIRDIIYLRVLYKQNIPVIIHFHSKKTGEFALVPNRLKLVGKRFKKYADKIILLSNDHFLYFTQYFKKEQCEILENFVDYSKFENEVSNKTNDLLFVGRLSKEKGFFDLLSACQILKSKNIKCKINIIGAAPNKEIQHQISQIVEEQKLDSIIEFHGLKFDKEKFEIFKSSKILLFPSHFENSPVVLKEAIAAKLAIVASDIEANKLILEGKGNYQLYTVKNSVTLASIIEKLLKNDDKVISMCNASESIKDYDKSFAQKKLLTIMNSLC